MSIELVMPSNRLYLVIVFILMLLQAGFYVLLTCLYLSASSFFWCKMIKLGHLAKSCSYPLLQMNCGLVPSETKIWALHMLIAGGVLLLPDALNGQTLYTHTHTHTHLFPCLFLYLSVKVKLCLLSCVWLFAAMWTVATWLLCPWDSPGKNAWVGSHPFSRRSSPPQGWTRVSCIAGRFFAVWATRELETRCSQKFF